MAANPEGLLSNPAVQLFVERARAIRDDFLVSARNAPAIVQICRHLDGMPLALELAAAWIDSMTAERRSEARSTIPAANRGESGRPTAPANACSDTRLELRPPQYAGASTIRATFRIRTAFEPKPVESAQAIIVIVLPAW